uniref:Uncharacterized protein n=1 Tax=Lactuca sativa TaxID=4236 RepID=A0A9R1XK04_LACSA|nr:hypothetical protein LSAT_V11C400211560 [Lactuca sativa]
MSSRKLWKIAYKSGLTVVMTSGCNRSAYSDDNQSWSCCWSVKSSEGVVVLGCFGTRIDQRCCCFIYRRRTGNKWSDIRYFVGAGRSSSPVLKLLSTGNDKLLPTGNEGNCSVVLWASPAA